MVVKDLAPEALVVARVNRSSNIEKIHGTFEFQNNPQIFNLTWEHDEAFVSGFTDQKSGNGTITLEMVVYCSEQGTSSTVTATWRLEDEVGLSGEERSVDLAIDFAACSSARRAIPSSEGVVVRLPEP